MNNKLWIKAFAGGENMDKNGKNTNQKVKMHKIMFAVGAAGVAGLNIASWQSVTFSDWYIKTIFPVWLNTYARLTSKFPFSVGEIMLILAVALTLFGIVFGIVNLVFRRRFQRAASSFGKFYAWTVLVVCYVMTLNCFIFYHSSSFA